MCSQPCLTLSTSSNGQPTHRFHCCVGKASSCCAVTLPGMVLVGRVCWPIVGIIPNMKAVKQTRTITFRLHNSKLGSYTAVTGSCLAVRGLHICLIAKWVTAALARALGTAQVLRVRSLNSCQTPACHHSLLARCLAQKRCKMGTMRAEMLGIW